MSHETSGEGCEVIIIECDGAKSDPITPLPPAHLARLVKLRQRYIDAGLMADAPLDPSAIALPMADQGTRPAPEKIAPKLAPSASEPQAADQVAPPRKYVPKTPSVIRKTSTVNGDIFEIECDGAEGLLNVVPRNAEHKAMLDLLRETYIKYGLLIEQKPKTEEGGTQNNNERPTSGAA